MINSDDH